MPERGSGMRALRDDVVGDGGEFAVECYVGFGGALGFGGSEEAVWGRGDGVGGQPGGFARGDCVEVGFGSCPWESGW